MVRGAGALMREGDRTPRPRPVSPTGRGFLSAFDLMWHGTRLEHSRHTRAGGYPVRRGPLSSIPDFSGILGRLPSRTMTARERLRSSPMTGFRFTFQIATSFADTTPRSRRGLRPSFIEFPVP